MLLACNAAAQDPHFSQFFANPMYTNPAFAGSSKVGRIVMNVRNQWPAIPGAFVTGNASYDEHFDAINGGFGVMAHFDEQGVGTLRTVALNLVYSYQILLGRRGKFVLRPALQVGMFQKSINFDKLQWFDQIVPTKGFIRKTGQVLPNEGKINDVNIAAGIVGYTSTFYFGIAAHNLTEPSQTFFPNEPYTSSSNAFVKIPMRYTAHFGMAIPLVYTQNVKKQSFLYPNVIYQQQNQFSEINLGMYASKGSYIAGVYFRQNMVNSDAIIGVLGIRTPKVKIGISYDATLYEHYPGASNSWEISLAFELKKHVRVKKVRPITCPDF